MKVKIFIETSWHGPRKVKGSAMFLVEFIKKDGTPETRQGYIFLDAPGTESQITLMAINAAVKILIRPCVITIYTSCNNILNVTHNYWYTSWEKNGWRNAKGKKVANAELWQQLIRNLQKHSYTFAGEHHAYEGIMKDSLRRKGENKNE